MQNDNDGQWLEVIAKTLAFLALKSGDVAQKTLLERGRFLANLGLNRDAAASLLGTTKESLAELERQSKKKGAKKHGKAKKK